jgi:hypothetical protein
MPACLVEQENGVFAGRDSLGDFLKVEVHRLRVAQG